MRYLSLLILAITLTSCLEGDDDLFETTGDVLFVNAYNDAAGGVNFRINDREWSNGFRAYDSVCSHTAFYSGNVTFSAHPAGSSAGEVIASTDYTIEPEMKYTSFLTGRSGEGKMIVLPDTMLAPAGNRAAIRFLNLSPDLSRVDVEIADSAKVISGLDYLNAGYLSVDTGVNVIRAYRAGENAPVVSLRFRAASRGVYTMYTRGILDRTGSDSLAIRYYIQP